MTKTPGWDAKAISDVAARHYDGFNGLFEKHEWSERGSDVMRKVQSRVKDTYGSIDAFVAKHEAGK